MANVKQCLFCRTTRDAEKIEGQSYICGNCVQILLNLSQEQLQKAHALAIERGHADKAQAIESFLEVPSHESRNKHYTSERLNGKRFVRTVGDDQDAGCGFEKPERPSLYQNRVSK